MPLAWLVRIQMLGAIGVLLWLIAATGLAASDGFLPTRERYAPHENSGTGALQLLKQVLPARGKSVIAVLGTSAEQRGAPLVEAALERLAEQGVEIRRCDANSVYSASAMAQLLCVIADERAHRELDWARLAAALARPLIVDFTTMIPGEATDAVGIEVINGGRPTWPAWLDPEFQLFVEHLRTKIPEADADEARILLLAGQRYPTAATRSRWFLMLNYALAPRRLYLRNPVEASGYVMQYFRWVDEINQSDTWSQVRYFHMADRSLTKLARSTSAPTRNLLPEELAAAEAVGADWVLLQSPNVDFRLVDWELVPLERARQWSETPR